MDSIKAFYDKYLRRWVKTIASAIGGAVAGLLINWFNGTTPIPTTKDEWVTLLVATIGPALLALISPANKITQKQLDKDPGIAPGTVVVPPSPENVVKTEDSPPPPVGGRKSSWT
jgi:uncharacterized membrane protein YeaQ/YmgE (transglycosylase-associated protein family)